MPKKLLLPATLALFLPWPSLAQVSLPPVTRQNTLFGVSGRPALDEFAVFASITRYLADGDAEALSAWFADNLEIALMGTPQNCSRTQARQILRAFFHTYPPRRFRELHKASEGNRKYLVGTLSAGGERFLVTIYATARPSETFLLRQLDIVRR